MIGSSAFADMKCITQGLSEVPTIQLEFHANNYYTVSIYGHSRNNYMAIYQRQMPSGFLKKVVDRSTWSDMPDHLQLFGNLVKTEPGRVYELVGLPVPGRVQFSEQRNCSL